MLPVLLPTTTMQAVVATTYGSPDVLRVERVAPPRMGASDVRVAVEAAAVTRGDVRMRAAEFGGLLALPGRLMFGVTGPRHAVPGTSFAGRILDVGAQVTDWRAGDAVFGLVLHGAHAAELVIRGDGALARRPEDVSAVTAASVAYGVATAWSFLADLAGLRAGEHVVVVGAGGVGRPALEVAAAHGATVTAVCGDDHASLARALGAARVVSREEGPAAFDRRAVDLVFDTTGRAAVGSWRRTLCPGGRFVATDITAARLASWALGRAGFGPRVMLGVAPDRRDVLERAMALVARGDVRPRVAAVFPLDEVEQAHRLVASGRPTGDVVLVPGPGTIAP